MWTGGSGSDKDEDKPLNLSSLFNWGQNDSLASWSDNVWNRFGDILNEPTQNSLNSILRYLTSASGPYLSYGTPSTSQYDACLTNGGRSLWTEDGFWRCLFKGESIPSHLKHEFKDYTGFLNYQRDLVKKQRQLAEEQRAKQDTAQPPATVSRPWGYSYDYGLSKFPVNESPKLISEKEAEGKNVIRQSYRTESVTLEDGSLQTRTESVKVFDDGTALVKNVTDTDSDASSKSWFWK